MSRGRLARLISLGLALVLPGCSGQLPTPGLDEPSSVPPGASASPLPPLPEDRRPVQPVPDVRPPGFTAPPPGRGLRRYTDQALSWRPCGSVRCANLLVPLDYARPDAMAITLTVAWRPAADGSRDRVPLLLNPGGPGASGVDFLKGFGLAGLENRDLVSWDPRGGGQSTPVRCWGAGEMDRYLAMDGSPDDAGEDAALVEANRRFGLSCLAGSGALLGYLSSEASVRDMELLRSALDADQIDYLGYSNGTLLGAGYAHLFPDRVDNMVLDGAVNISDSPVTQAEGFERALRDLATWCADRRCGLGRTSEQVVDTVTALWDRLDERPLRVGQRQLTQQLAVAGVVQALYLGQAGWSSAAPALEAAVRRRDGTSLLAWADAATWRRRDGSYDVFAYAFPASYCADEPNVGLKAARNEAKRVLTRAPTIARYIGPDIFCAVWPVNAPPALPRLVAAGAPPLVVVGTTGDPATPHEWAQGMAEQLRSGVLVTHRGSGHSSSGSQACGAMVVAALDGRTPADGSTC